MRKNITEIVFVLDRSGSMYGLEADTIGGFNSMLEDQKEKEGEAYVSAVLFDDQQEVIYDRVPIGRVEPMTKAQYRVGGSTALLDALGGAIHHFIRMHRYMSPERRPAKTLFIIITDGMENASRKYSYEKVKRMIEKEKKDYGWEFLFLGANIDAAKEAGRFGIDPDRAVDYKCDKVGTRLNYRVLSETIAQVRCMEPCLDSEKGRCSLIREDWADEIRRDHRKRR